MTSLDNTSLKPMSIEIIGNRKINKATGVEIEQEETPPAAVFNSFSTPPSKSIRSMTDAEVEDTVFPSDHFGLLAEFVLSDENDCLSSS